MGGVRDANVPKKSCGALIDTWPLEVSIRRPLASIRQLRRRRARGEERVQALQRVDGDRRLADALAHRGQHLGGLISRDGRPERGVGMTSPSASSSIARASEVS